MFSNCAAVGLFTLDIPFGVSLSLLYIGGNVSITVMPCHGRIAWNITYVNARMFSHPVYPTGRRRRRDLRDAEAAVLPRKKRCCITAGVTHDFNFDIAGERAIHELIVLLSNSPLCLY